MQDQTQVVQLSVKVSVEIGRIGDSHALVDSTIYALPVAPSTECTVLKRTRQLVESKDIEQTVERIFNDPLALMADHRNPVSRFDYVTIHEFEVAYIPLKHARIVDGVAVNTLGVALTPDTVLDGSRFTDLAASLAGSVPFPQKMLFDELSIFEDSFKLNNEWLDLRSAMEALNAIPGIVAEVLDIPPAECSHKVQQSLRIIVDMAVHRPAIEAAIDKYHEYEADETVECFESQNMFSLTFNTLVKPVIAPFIIKNPS